MAPPLHDEEMAKKDDEHRPRASSSPKWAPARLPRRRRFFFLVLGIFVLYVFLNNMPHGLPPVPSRFDTRVPGRLYNGLPLISKIEPETQDLKALPATGSDTDGKEGLSIPPGNVNSEVLAKSQPPLPDHAPPRSEEDEDEGHYYNGEVNILSLPHSILAAQPGFSKDGRHLPKVVFATASTLSATRLLPIACEMAARGRSTIHFVYHGRDGMGLDQLRELNGAGEGCKVHFHDARPDFAPFSSDRRLAKAIGLAVAQVHGALYPAAYVVENSDEEEPALLRAMREKTSTNRRAVLELPKKAQDTMMWLTRLEGEALARLADVRVNIVIQTDRGDSTTIARLLKSIAKADYTCLTYPHITIELPAELDEKTEALMGSFVWPPRPSSGEPDASQFTIRRRIAGAPPSSREAAIGTVEAFYPSSGKNSHVLVLTPLVELSPFYYHYLMYNLLEYRYTTENLASADVAALMGISLTTPATLLDDKTPFTPPAPLSAPASETGGRLSPARTTPFRWQAPNPDATLYFGDKWLELHNFLHYRYTLSTVPIARRLPATYPAFAEPMLELMYARGYTMLYPNLPAHAIAHRHATPFSPPIENLEPPTTPQTNDPYLPFHLSAAALRPPPSSGLGETTPSSDTDRGSPPLSLVPLDRVLPSDGLLPDIADLPLLDSSGTPIETEQLIEESVKRANTFRTTAGQCPDNVPWEFYVRPGSAADLFCVDGEALSGNRRDPSGARSSDHPQTGSTVTESNTHNPAGRHAWNSGSGSGSGSSADVDTNSPSANFRSAVDQHFADGKAGAVPDRGGSVFNPSNEIPASVITPWVPGEPVELPIDQEERDAMAEEYRAHLRRIGEKTGMASSGGETGVTLDKAGGSNADVHSGKRKAAEGEKNQAEADEGNVGAERATEKPSADTTREETGDRPAGW